MPDVSVIIPAYNAEPYLEAALKSVLTQTYRDFEVIVLDDCSTDGTWGVIQHFAASDSRIKAFRNQQNQGIAGNRNRGVSLASGRYVVWQDADDISLPYRIEHQLAYMESHPEAGMVGGFIELFRDDQVIGIRKYPADDVSLRRCIFRYSPIAQPAAMIRMEALKRAGEYDRRYPPAEDIDMTFRIGTHYKLANLQEVVIRYRESSTSATFTKLRKMELSTLEVRRKYAKTFGYRMTAADKLYNVLHLMSVWLVPAKLKIRLFNFWRNSAARSG